MTDSAMLYILDPGFQNTKGHHYEYNKALFHAAGKLAHEISIIANSRLDTALLDYPAENYFDSSYYTSPIKDIGSFITYLLVGLRSNYRFYRELHRRFKNLNLSESRFYLPTIDHNLFVGLLWWCFRRPKSDRPDKIVTLWMYSYERYGGRSLVGYASLIPSLIFRLLDLFFPARDIFQVATETTGLRDSFQQYTSHPVITVPIPHQRNTDLPAVSNDSDLIRISYLGPARREKGFLLLAPALKKLTEISIDEKWRFLIQAAPAKHERNSVELIDTIKNLCETNYPFLDLVDRELSTEDYNRSLAESDIIVLPYLRREYINRGSGIFMEAISADKYVVVPADTWMAEQIVSGVNGVTFESGNTESLAAAISLAIKKCRSTAVERTKVNEEFKQFHQAENLVRILAA